MSSYAPPSPSASRPRTFLRGLRDGAPFILVVGPFALLFGVVASEAGLNIFETLAFSIVVIAGAAQMTALQLLGQNTPEVIILISALAVNLRMAMYSASLTPYIGAAPLWKRAIAAYFTVDQSYALSVIAFEKHKGWDLQARLGYFFGVALAICPFWYTLSLVGALLGSAIPDALALDFALPITFIAMVAPLLRSRPQIAACVSAVVLALCFAWLPYNFGLLVGALGGMTIGARVERMTGGPATATATTAPQPEGEV